MAEERRVEAGQRISGSMSYRTYNTMLELVRQLRLQRLGEQGGDERGDELDGGVLVLVTNATGTTQPPGAVLSLRQGTPLDPAGQPADFLARPCFSGGIPSSSADVVCVLREGAGPGDTSLAVCRGLAVVWLNLTTPAHAYAVPVANDTAQMKSATAGSPILWTETGSAGVQQAVVLLEQGGGRDAAGAVTAPAFGPAVETTVTAGITTTLTTDSAGVQVFTGTAAQTVQLPDVGTLSLNRPYTVVNQSTQPLTVNSSGGSQISQVQPGTQVTYYAATTTPTGTAADWYATLSGTTVSPTAGGGGATVGTVAAAGSTQGDAAFLPYDNNNVTGADYVKGVILDAARAEQAVYNADLTNNLLVYPPSGAKIDGLATNAAYTQSLGSARGFRRFSPTQWISHSLS